MAAMNDPLAAPAAGDRPSAMSRAPARCDRHVLVGHRQQPARRPQPRREPRPRPQLQHRVARGRPHRAARHQPHDDHAPRRRLRGRADGQAALPDHRRAQGPGPARDAASSSTSWRSSRSAPRTTSGAELLKIIELYKGRVLDIGPESVVVEHAGTEQEIDSLVALLGGFGIRELVRTGTVALARGSGAIDIEGILRAGPVPAVPQPIASRGKPDARTHVLRRRRDPPRRSRARPSRSSATAARATRMPRTCATAASTSSSGLAPGLEEPVDRRGSRPARHGRRRRGARRPT